MSEHDERCPICGENNIYIRIEYSNEEDAQFIMPQREYSVCCSSVGCEADLHTRIAYQSGNTFLFEDEDIVIECLMEQWKVYKRYIKKAKLLRKPT